MRYFLGILLALCVLLQVAWCSASFLYSQASHDLASLGPDWAQSPRTQPRVARALSRLDVALALDPGLSRAWLERGISRQVYYNLLPPQRQAGWELDLARAEARGPALAAPLLQLALACAKGYSQLPSRGPEHCDRLFQAILQRAPQYGYARFRYADFLYTRALADTAHRGQLTASLCGQYGQALEYMAGTDLLQDWHEQRAYANCLNLAGDYADVASLRPATPKQWGRLGRDLGRRGEAFWQKAQAAALADLADQQAPAASYLALARGLASRGLHRAGAEVLQAYVAHRPQDTKGWKDLVFYLEQNAKWVPPAALPSAIYQAERKAELEIPAALHLLTKSCQLNQRLLAEAYAAKLLQKYPQSGPLLVCLARCSLGFGLPQQAIDYYEKALDQEPDSLQLHLELGRLYASQKDYTRAVEQFQRAIDLNPRDRRARREIRRMGLAE